MMKCQTRIHNVLIPPKHPIPRTSSLVAIRNPLRAPKDVLVTGADQALHKKSSKVIRRRK